LRPTTLVPVKSLAISRWSLSSYFGQVRKLLNLGFQIRQPALANGITRQMTRQGIKKATISQQC
jgi:hypothetical protein